MSTRAQLRRLASLQASGAALDPDDWNALCDAAIASLWRRVLKANNQFRVKLATISITAITSPSGTLPSDFMDVVSVFRSKGTPSEEPISKVGPKTGSMDDKRGYRLDDNSPTSLFIDPYTLSIGVYTVAYNPQPPLLTTDSQALSVELQQFEDYVVHFMATHAISADEGDAGTESALLTDARTEVVGWAGKGRSPDPDRVEDVRQTRGRRRFLPLP